MFSIGMSPETKNKIEKIKRETKKKLKHMNKKQASHKRRMAKKKYVSICKIFGILHEHLDHQTSLVRNVLDRPQ